MAVYDYGTIGINCDYDLVVPLTYQYTGVAVEDATVTARLWTAPRNDDEAPAAVGDEFECEFQSGDEYLGVFRANNTLVDGGRYVFRVEATRAGLTIKTVWIHVIAKYLGPNDT